MFYEFFVNACILMTFITLVYLFFKDIKISDCKSLLFKIGTGLYGGALGVILLIHSVNVEHNIIIDLRYIPLILCAIYFGTISTIIASVVIGSFRILYFGISGPSTIAMIATLIVGIGLCYISSLHITRNRKWTFSTFFALLVSSIALRIIIHSTTLFLEVVAIYWISYLIVSSIIFYYSQNLYESINLQKALNKEVTKDHLTGLDNLRKFESTLDSLTKQNLNKNNISLLFIDIDFFKNINNTYGHIAGNKILKQLAKILSETFGENDVISRNGGEEFSVILPECSAIQAVKIGEELIKKVAASSFKIFGNKDLKITISIGVSSYPEITDQIEKLLDNADIALYKAKACGRSRVELYDNCI